MCYKSHLRFPPGNSLHASRRRTGVLPKLQKVVKNDAKNLLKKAWFRAEKYTINNESR